MPTFRGSRRPRTGGPEAERARAPRPIAQRAPLRPPCYAPTPTDMANDPNEKEDHEGDLATERKGKLEKVRRYKVLLHNDDYTTMEFVIDVLMKFFHKSETEATHIMLSVHHKGHGVAGVYTKDVAETKVAQVTDHAKEQGMPLRLSVEPE